MKILVDVTVKKNLEKAKDAIAIAMFDAMLQRDNKDIDAANMRKKQLIGLEIAAQTINNIILAQERIEKADNFEPSKDSPKM
ncbi:MAG: hypothetical protein VW270_23490 [Candidatus Poseidoniales archaeon]